MVYNLKGVILVFVYFKGIGALLRNYYLLVFFFWIILLLVSLLNLF